MRKTFLFALLISTCFLQAGYSQKEWAPIGAKWFMNVPVNSGINEPSLKNYYVIESKKDTIINSTNFRLVGNYPMLQENYDIYYLFQDTLRLIYAFNVSIGDTVNFNMLDCSESIVNLDYTIENIDSVVIDNDTLRRITCNILPNRDFNPNPYIYIEKIGATRTIIENLAACAWIPESEPEWLRCYQDNDIFYKTSQFMYYGDKDCDYVEPISYIGERDFEEFKFFPTPSTEIIKILNITEPGFLTITKITGEQILIKHLSEGAEINISHLEKGLYICSFQSKNGIIKTYKLLKN